MNTGNDSPQRHGDPAQAPSNWWIAVLGHILHWALLRERESGTAEVLDHDGNLHAYDSQDTARSMRTDGRERVSSVRSSCPTKTEGTAMNSTQSIPHPAWKTIPPMTSQSGSRKAAGSSHRKNA